MQQKDFLYSLANRDEYDTLITYVETHDDNHVQYGAAGVLVEFSERFKMKTNSNQVDRLITIVITNSNDRIRSKVLELLIETQDDSILEEIVSRLGDNNFSDPPEKPYPRILTKWHASEEPPLRMLAIVGFASINEVSYHTKIRTSIQNESHPDVLQKAIEAGGEIGDETFVTPIQQYIYKESTEFQTTNISKVEDIKKVAIDSLVQIGTEASYEALLAATRKNEKTLKQYAIKKIGEFGADKSIDIVVTELTNKSENIRKSAAKSVLKSVQEVEEDGHKARLKILNELSTDSNITPSRQFAEITTESNQDPERRNSAWLLGQIKDSSTNTITALFDAIQSEDPYLRQIAAASLYQLDKTKVVKEIDEQIDSIEKETPAYNLLSYIRDQLEKEHKKDVIEYTYVSDPEDYTNRNNK